MKENSNALKNYLFRLTQQVLLGCSYSKGGRTLAEEHRGYDARQQTYEGPPNSGYHARVVKRDDEGV